MILKILLPELTTKDEKDIMRILEQTREQLLPQEGLMFDGDPASPEAINSILMQCRLEWKWLRKEQREIHAQEI